jgi:hypothetical protein
MKSIISFGLLLLIILFFVMPLQGQDNADYFPYEKDNYWEYYWIESSYPDTIVSLSVFDSTDNEGRKIAVFDSYFINPITPPALLPDSGTFIIDTNLNVFSNWAPLGYNEYSLIYKLNGNQGDQWVIYDYSQIGGEGYEMARIREIYDDVVLGTQTKIMDVLYYYSVDSTDTTGLERGADFLAKGFGLLGRVGEAFLGYPLLKGAVINEILFGDTTNIIVGLNENYRENQPNAFKLYQNYPNPFNPSTTIKFRLQEFQNISLIIYNTLGKEVIKLIDNSYYTAGTHEKSWSGTDSNGNKVTSGVYFYCIEMNNTLYTMSMILIK